MGIIEYIKHNIPNKDMEKKNSVSLSQLNIV